MSKQSDNSYDVIVVGAGPAGMMAAGTAASHDASVLLLEKNAIVGKKLSITGGGRCNITNNTLDPKQFLEKFPQSKKFLYSPFSVFNASHTIEFFESLALPLVTQARNRMFPHTERAPDVTGAMKQHCNNNGVMTKTNQVVTKVERTDDGFLIKTKTDMFECRRLILSTGGYAAPETGSTGDGFKWLEKLGHTVSKPSPNIVPLKTDIKWVHRLAGVDWSYLKMRFYADSKQQVSKTGKLLFTHFGISGPMVLNTSHEVSGLLSWTRDVVCSLDLYPDTEINELDKRIVKLLEQHSKKKIENVLGELLPRLVVTELLPLVQIAFGTIAGSIDRSQRKRIVNILKDLRFPITGTMGFDRAVIADGGVPLSEIDTATMQSKTHPNLYIIGDLIDINRPSGGYGLQMCWTTGHVAGIHAGSTKGAQ